MNREDAGLANSLINTLYRFGMANVDDALAICDTALYYNPDSRILRRSKGMGLYMKRQYEEADTLYARLLAEGDSSYNTIKYGGASKYLSGRYLTSIDLLEKALTMDSAAIDVNILLGAALGRTYDRQRAHQLFDRVELLMKPDEALYVLLQQSRALTLKAGGQPAEAARLYYLLWQRAGRLDLLYAAANLLHVNDVKAYQSADSRQRSLFLQIRYIREYLSGNGSPKFLYSYRSLLHSLYEDMFFRGITEEPLLSPDGKRSTINVLDVRQLYNQIPDTPPVEVDIEVPE